MTVRRFPGRERGTVGEAYRAAQKAYPGVDPFEAGILGRLADNECRHGRLPFDRTDICGCWAEEQVQAAPQVEKKPRRARRRAA